MTVNIPTVNTVELTPEQKRDHVIAYLSRPHGTKGRYLAQHNLSASTIATWRRGLADGDLERGLIPRQTGRMTFKEVRENIALRAQLEEMQAKLDASEARNNSSDTTIAKLKKNNEELHTAIDALGKAIAIMHKDGAE